MQSYQRRVIVDLGEEDQSAIPSTPRIPLAEAVAVGLVVVAACLVILAYHKATTTSKVGSYDATFWVGMVLAYLTVAWRAVSGPYTIRWLGFLGLFTVLPKFWMSPNGPIYFDESAHYALLRDVISSGHLFQYSPLLPIGTFYPGMESAAATIHWLTGLSPWDSALTLIAVVHSLLLVQIYYIARALSLPHRWAVVAGLVYAVNPSFIYEDVQFAYESVAILLMLTILRLYADAMAAERSEGNTWRQSLSTSLLIAVMSFGCVVTHHLTSLTGVGLLLAGALVFKPQDGFLDRKGSWRRQFVRWTPALTLGACFALWVVFMAPKTVPYLFPHLSQPMSQLLGLLKIGHPKSGSGLRGLFSNSRAPGYERVAAFAAPALISLTLLVVVIRWLWKRRFESNFLWSFVLTAVYLVSLPLTLLSGGAAGAHRTWASTWAGIALLPAALVFLFQLDQRKRWLKATATAMGAVALAVLLIGNVAAGTPMDYRFPGPYEFGSDTLSVTPETLAFASWVQEHLGTEANVVTDRYTALALTDHADAVTPLPVTGLPLEEIWYDKRPPDPALMNVLERQQDDYLAIDLRDTKFTATEAPLFEAGEPALVPVQNMTRLAHWPWLKLLYSSQNYRLYKINFDQYYLWYPFHAKAED